MKVYTKEANGGIQEVYRFANGYGASVIRGGAYAYGGLELAVAKFNSDTDNDDWSICYDTSVTDDVLGYLNEKTLADALTAIEQL